MMVFLVTREMTAELRSLCPSQWYDCSADKEHMWSASTPRSSCGMTVELTRLERSLAHVLVGAHMQCLYTSRHICNASTPHGTYAMPLQLTAHMECLFTSRHIWNASRAHSTYGMPLQLTRSACELTIQLSRSTCGITVECQGADIEWP